MTNLDIAQAAKLLPISTIAERAGLAESDFDPYGRTKAKLTQQAVARLSSQKGKGKLILVTAVTPTPSGEGKTTTAIGLTQGLMKLGQFAVSATREPALGPVLGAKGGAAGGGYSQVLPMEDINLFFTGDFPAITAANNLLSAAIDAHLHHGNALDIDIRRKLWPRAVDMNDRALREILVGLGGIANGIPRADGVVITPASEVMAILCLSRNLSDLKERLGNAIAAMNRKNDPILAKEFGVVGAMAAILRDAVRPNLVQTIEGGPALIHGGPFANIAHGCSSVVATECALGMGGYVVTEAGFAADLGAEKFMHLVTPQLGRGPDAIVIVATVRALKYHGGGEDLAALEGGMDNLRRHVEHMKRYGPPVIVAINSFPTDTPQEHEAIVTAARAFGAEGVVSDPWGSGGEGCRELAACVVEASSRSATFTPLLNPSQTVEEKITKIATHVYGASDVEFSPEAQRRLKWCEKHGMDHFPVCMAKTQYSFSDDPKAGGLAKDFTFRVRELRPSAGAGFLVAIAGDMMLMPGLGQEFGAQRIDIDSEGRISGLF
jgi:formate--tetrahydrofolate ligase